MKRSDTIGELAKALTAFHAAVKNPKNDKVAETPKYSFPYFDFADVLDADRPLLTAQGLALVQELVVADGMVGAATMLMHTSGEWLELAPAFVPAGDYATDYGAAASYSRKYAYMAALSLAGTDDGSAPPQGKAKSAGPGKSSEAQQKKIHVEAKQAGVSDDDLAKVLAKRYQAKSTKDLTKEQASDLIERLIAEKEKREELRAGGTDPDTGEVADTEDYWPQDEEAPGMSAEEAKAKWAANQPAAKGEEQLL